MNRRIILSAAIAVACFGAAASTGPPLTIQEHRVDAPIAAILERGPKSPRGPRSGTGTIHDRKRKAHALRGTKPQYRHQSR